MIVMILRGDSLGEPTGYDGQYLKDFDFEAYSGQGMISMTPDLAQAKRFASVFDAWEFRKRQPVCRPLRPDGLPNRPLTATTWEFVDEALI